MVLDIALNRVHIWYPACTPWENFRFTIELMDPSTKTFSTVISLNSRLLKLPRNFYRHYHERFPARLWVELVGGTNYPAVVHIDAGGIAYLDTDTDKIMNVLRADGLYGAPESREAQLTYFSSRGVFALHCPMTADRLRPRLMRH